MHTVTTQERYYTNSNYCVCYFWDGVHKESRVYLSWKPTEIELRKQSQIVAYLNVGYVINVTNPRVCCIIVSY